MFNYLREIDEKIFNRFTTVVLNIKSASNSFYDSFLDMLETFIKIVVDSNNLQVKERATCGGILKETNVKNFFLNELHFDVYYFNKMLDYTLKVNHHKHNNEKKIQIDTIISYLKVLHTVTSSYAKYKNLLIDEFDAEIYINMFGQYEKENTALRNEKNLLQEELETLMDKHKIKDSFIAEYKQLLSDSELAKLSIEEQNNELHKQISKLKDIKLSSMEEKLNKTIDLLNELTESVIENRAISYAVGDTICSRDMFEKYVSKARAELNKGKENGKK